MKKILRYLLYLIGAVLIFIAGFALFIQVKGIPKYEPKEIAMVVNATPDKVLQGKKLAEMLCVKCHLDANTGLLTGKYLADAPEMFGEIYSKNITQSADHGIGKWTDGQIAYLLRTGIKPDGSFIPPYMPKFAKMADSDVESIIAWLRSEDPRLAASDVIPPPTQESWFTKFLCNVAIKPIPYDGVPISLPDTSDAIAHGRYLATSQLQCFACHSKDFTKVDDLHPEQSLGFFGGGNEMLDYERKPINTANITFDDETGIGSWTEQDFLVAVKQMRTPHGKVLQYPMEPYVQLDDKEVSHIYAYLKTVPKLKNRVVRR